MVEARSDAVTVREWNERYDALKAAVPYAVPSQRVLALRKELTSMKSIGSRWSTPEASGISRDGMAEVPVRDPHSRPQTAEVELSAPVRLTAFFESTGIRRVRSEPMPLRAPSVHPKPAC